MKNKIFAYLVPIFALILASIVGFYSVTGLSKLFAGAALAVIVMASVLEAVKLLGTAVLHLYWKKIPILIRTYLIIGVIILMTITSAGVYGFLSDAYKKTANRFSIHKTELELLDRKKNIIESKIQSISEQIETKNSQMKTLIDVRKQQESRLDSMMMNKHWYSAKQTQNLIKESSERIAALEHNVDSMINYINFLKDSISSIEIAKMDKESTNEAASELGPLIYLSDLLNRPMDDIINWFMLLLIFVADPFAVILVIVSTKIFENSDSDLKVDEALNEDVSDENEKDNIIVENDKDSQVDDIKIEENEKSEESDNSEEREIIDNKKEEPINKAEVDLKQVNPKLRRLYNKNKK